jgi:hypothetical protein
MKKETNNYKLLETKNTEKQKKTRTTSKEKIKKEFRTREN